MQMVIPNTSSASVEVKNGSVMTLAHPFSLRKALRELSARDSVARAVAGEQACRLQNEPRVSLVQVEMLRHGVGVRWALRVGTFSIDADILIDHGSLSVSFGKLPYGIVAKRDHIGVEKAVTGEDHLYSTVRRAIQKMLHLS